MPSLRSPKPAVPKRAPSSAERSASDAVVRLRIERAMEKWLSMDAAGKLLGRGLGRRNIMERVALEIGASVRLVRSTLRSEP